MTGDHGGDVGEPTGAVLLATPAPSRAVQVHIVEPGDLPPPVPEDTTG